MQARHARQGQIGWGKRSKMGIWVSGPWSCGPGRRWRWRDGNWAHLRRAHPWAGAKHQTQTRVHHLPVEVAAGVAEEILPSSQMPQNRLLPLATARIK